MKRIHGNSVFYLLCYQHGFKYLLERIEAPVHDCMDISSPHPLNHRFSTFQLQVGGGILPPIDHPGQQLEAAFLPNPPGAPFRPGPPSLPIASAPTVTLRHQPRPPMPPRGMPTNIANGSSPVGMVDMNNAQFAVGGRPPFQQQRSTPAKAAGQLHPRTPNGKVPFNLLIPDRAFKCTI